MINGRRLLDDIGLVIAVLVLNITLTVAIEVDAALLLLALLDIVAHVVGVFVPAEPSRFAPGGLRSDLDSRGLIYEGHKSSAEQEGLLHKFK